MQKRCGVPSHQCSVRGTTKRPRKTWNRKTRRVSNHATHLTYSAFLEDWSFSNKAKYARMRTPRGPRRASDGSPRVLLHRLPVLPTSKVSPSANYNKYRIEVRPLFHIFCNSPPAGGERPFRARRCQRTMREVYHLPPTPVKSGKGEVWVFGSLEVETRRDYPPDGSCPRIDTNFTNTNQSVLIREIRGQTPTFQTSKPPNQILL